MRKRASLVIAVAALLATGANAQAQGIADLTSGVRVRVTIPDSVRQAPYLRRTRTIIGTLVRATPDTLWLHIAGPDTVRLPRLSAAVQVSRGVSRARSALEHGVGMGLAFGLISYAAADYRRGARQEALEMAGVTAVVAAAVGAWRPYERWRTVR